MAPVSLHAGASLRAALVAGGHVLGQIEAQHLAALSTTHLPAHPGKMLFEKNGETCMIS